jgi:hypothetical protein
MKEDETQRRICLRVVRRLLKFEIGSTYGGRHKRKGGELRSEQTKSSR